MTCLMFPLGDASWQVGPAALADDAPPTSAATTAAVAAATSAAPATSLALDGMVLPLLRVICGTGPLPADHAGAHPSPARLRAHVMHGRDTPRACVFKRSRS